MIFPWQFWVDNDAREFRTVNPFYTNTIDLDIYIKYYFIPRGKYHVMGFKHIQWQFIAAQPFAIFFKVIIQSITHDFYLFTCYKQICIICE